MTLNQCHIPTLSKHICMFFYIRKYIYREILTWLSYLVFTKYSSFNSSKGIMLNYRLINILSNYPLIQNNGSFIVTRHTYSKREGLLNYVFRHHSILKKVSLNTDSHSSPLKFTRWIWYEISTLISTLLFHMIIH